MVFSKGYYTLDEAAEKIECTRQDVIHLAANGRLSICLIAKGWLVDLYYRPDDEGLWKLLALPNGQPRKALGPVRLALDDVRLLEADSQATTRRFGALLDEPAPEGNYEYRLCDVANGQVQPDVRIADCELVVLAPELKALLEVAHGEKPGNNAPADDLDRPVEWRERTKLLCIIHVLAKEAKIDISQVGKAAAVIESMTIESCCKVSSRTVAGHLKRIPEALLRGGKED